MATMQAVEWDETKGKVELVNAPRPSKPAPKRVIVKVAYAGICGTDLHIMKKEFAAAPRVILGHETSGIVSEIGADVTSVKVGDKVGVQPASHCGVCRFCLRSQVNYCIIGGLRGYVGVTSNGGWAEYLDVSEEQAVVLPPGVSLRQAVFCEPISCIVRGWHNNGLVPDDSDILIMGCGIIGLLWQCVFHHHGYRNITVTEITQERNKLAEGLDLGYKICHPDDVKLKMANILPEEDGFDLIVETTGNAKAIENAFPWLRRGGKLNVFGCCPKKATMTINPAEFMLREVSIISTLTNPFTFPKTTQLTANMAEKYLNYDKLGIQEFSLKQHDSAFEMLKNGAISKAVFKVSGD